MAGAESVVFALGALGKTGDAAELAQGGHGLAPPGQNLVRIGLVADIPHQPVVRRVEHVVQGDGQLHRTQVGRQMAAGPAHAFDQEGAQLLGELGQLLAVEGAQLSGVVDGFE